MPSLALVSQFTTVADTFSDTEKKIVHFGHILPELLLIVKPSKFVVNVQLMWSVSCGISMSKNAQLLMAYLYVHKV